MDLVQVCCILERLRGAARATESRTQKAIFDMAVAAMDPVLALLEIYKDEVVPLHFCIRKKTISSLIVGCSG